MMFIRRRTYLIWLDTKGENNCHLVWVERGHSISFVVDVFFRSSPSLLLLFRLLKEGGLLLRWHTVFNEKETTSLFHLNNSSPIYAWILDIDKLCQCLLALMMSFALVRGISISSYFFLHCFVVEYSIAFIRAVRRQTHDHRACNKALVASLYLYLSPLSSSWSSFGNSITNLRSKPHWWNIQRAPSWKLSLTF